MSDEQIRKELAKIEELRRRGLATWDDEARATRLRRMEVERAMHGSR